MYRVYNIVNHNTSNSIKIDVIKSKRIILPPSAIKGIEESKYFIFRISVNNKYRMKYTTMVYEFSAPEGIMYMSENLMDELCINSGNFVRTKFIPELPDANFIRIRPDDSEFTKLSDPKCFLERGIVKYYPVLNIGETIRIGKYKFDVIDIEPEDIVLTVDTDLSVDFLEPKDMIVC